MGEQDTNLPVMVGRLDGKMDVLLQRTAGFEARITAVEHKVWWVSGVAAAVMALVAPQVRHMFGL